MRCSRNSYRSSRTCVHQIQPNWPRRSLRWPSHGFHRPAPPDIEGPSRARRISEGLLPHSKAGDEATVSYHYDQSNEFYSMFLGPSMTYSCAVFDSPLMSLEAAQK